ncbi:MAG: glycosyltransferase family 2 protein [Bacteroidia bacterium]
MPFVSIVVPTYNRANLVTFTIESILKQDNPDFELIIVDDGSTDNTQEVVAPYLSEKVSYHKIPNSERGAARNFGTKQAKGVYVNWFDSDDIMLPNHVSTIINLARFYGNPEVITLNFQIKHSKTGKLEKDIYAKNRYAMRNSRFLIRGNYLACNPVVVRKDIALLNPFDENRKLSAHEDYELWLRLNAQYHFCQSRIVTSYLIQHENRSENKMIKKESLETRFLTFIDTATKNEKIVKFLGNEKDYFMMRNLLILSVNLAYNRHKKAAFNYTIKAIKYHKAAFFQLVFWNTIKHIIIA